MQTYQLIVFLMCKTKIVYSNQGSDTKDMRRGSIGRRGSVESSAGADGPQALQYDARAACPFGEGLDKLFRQHVTRLQRRNSFQRRSISEMYKDGGAEKSGKRSSMSSRRGSFRGSIQDALSALRTHTFFIRSLACVEIGDPLEGEAKRHKA